MRINKVFKQPFRVYFAQPTLSSVRSLAQFVTGSTHMVEPRPQSQYNELYIHCNFCLLVAIRLELFSAHSLYIQR